MSASSPHDVFAQAQHAMQRQDFETFFECVDPKAVRRFASVALYSPSAAMRALSLNHGVTERALAEIATLGEKIQASAEATRARLAMGVPVSLDDSLQHRELVKGFDAAVARALKTATRLPAFAAAVERLRRATEGGGSVSSTLFVGEELSDVVISGTRANGVRRLAGGQTQSVSFLSVKGRWFVRLF